MAAPRMTGRRLFFAQTPTGHSGMADPNTPDQSFP
jgi:hypothetical protein